MTRHVGDDAFTDPAATVRAVWRGHNRWLVAFGLGSTVAGVLYYLAAAGPDGRDPFYVAVAAQFAIWGMIDAAFGVLGIVGERRVRTDDATSLVRGHRLVELLRKNRWLNALWLTLGVALLVAGYATWSPSTVGHGVGILFQACVLVALDETFLRRLRRAIA